ncbi:uncharacterized protein BX663DRAFT_433185 [Cokeromyces recurvatus]|uniref:uncharacterized protein n=1 Tax=Cokeromyces recurvatus TaxID=90255 RepID=UPI00222036FF|nr:uncharacterized protein BX663DRAFT_433185 [Cokeromyces recurvatus]KAI7903481.1 hypothetical protein BX663DRAFT_433185 [Cokeromyces recurvatus]
MSSNLQTLPLPASTFANKQRLGKYFINSKRTVFNTSILYLIITLAVTFVNKLLFANSEYKFPYPIFTVFFQLVITFIFITLWTIIKPFPYFFNVPTRFQWNFVIAKHVAPLTLSYICVIVYNPLFLRYVEITTYHFSHSLSIAFSILFSTFMLKVNIPYPVQTAAIIIIFGICTGSMGNLNFSFVSLFYSLAWPFIVALYGIYLKKALVYLKNNLWCLLQYNTIMSIAFMIPIVLLSGELKEILSTVWFWDEIGFWIQMIITAMTGFCVNIIMMVFLIQTSPLSLTIISVSKTIIQAFIAVFIFDNRMTLLNTSGFLIALAGSCYYAYLKSNEKDLVSVYQ